MSVVRETHTETLLTNGQVLVAGGCGYYPNYAYASVELYNPASSTWTATGSMSATRCGQQATLLTSGQVLVTEGGPFTAEFYTP